MARDCKIGPNAIILDSVIGDACTVGPSVIESSTLEDHVDMGPFCHLRPGAYLSRHVHLGNFAEVKKSRLGEGVHMGHFSYMGDAEVGAHTNIGAGTITCNYDGKNKHQTIIGENVFIGSDSMLVAPLTIGDNARTGAGAVVTKDVPADSLAVGVPCPCDSQIQIGQCIDDVSPDSRFSFLVYLTPILSLVLLDLSLLVAWLCSAIRSAIMTVERTRVDAAAEQGDERAKTLLVFWTIRYRSLAPISFLFYAALVGVALALTWHAFETSQEITPRFSEIVLVLAILLVGKIIFDFIATSRSFHPLHCFSLRRSTGSTHLHRPF